MPARIQPAILCGILASVLYIAMNVFIPMMYGGYNSASQTVSELSAIGAPSRPLWVVLGSVYSLLIILFGYGVWKSAEGSRALRVAGVLLAVNGALSLYWPPMHMRGTEATLTDTLHIVWSIVTVLLMMTTMIVITVAASGSFRIVSIAMLLLMLVTGAMTGLDAPDLAANLPTPWIGIWERVSIGAYMVWIIGLARHINNGRL